MERTFSPMIRQYSAIDGLQQAYTLVYAMEVEGTQGCRLTLCQIGSRQQIVSQHVAAAPESFSIPMSFHFLTYAIACIMPGVLLTFALPER